MKKQTSTWVKSRTTCYRDSLYGMKHVKYVMSGEFKIPRDQCKYER